MNTERMRLVTISAPYGAGGSVVAPALAKLLGVPFLQRATTSEGELGVPAPCLEQLAPEEAELVPAHRFFASLTQSMPAGPTQSPPPARHHEDIMRRQCESGIRQLAADEAGVILGRGAAVVLGRNRGLHVRLDGPAAARASQGAAIEGIALDKARLHMNAADKARDAYVRRLYRANPLDPRFYHLMIDSTVIPLDTVTEIIIRALSALPVPVQARLAVTAVRRWRRRR
jgi:cytidylate kinase